MSGRSARTKGKRGEYLVRDYLRARGWEAERVPGSGAFSFRQGGADLQHDVVATKGARTIRLEVKNREDFGRIYSLYEAHCKLKQDDVLAFTCPGEKALTLRMSTSLDAVFDGPDFIEGQARHPLYEKYKRTFSKLAGMQRLLQGADVLCIKMNHKPLLFVRYR